VIGLLGGSLYKSEALPNQTRHKAALFIFRFNMLKQAERLAPKKILGKTISVIFFFSSAPFVVRRGGPRLSFPLAPLHARG